MIRRIIQIDEEKCNGCGACAAACHESAIGMVDGKAKLLVTITAMDWETACRHARQELLLLWREKRQLMMRRQ